MEGYNRVILVGRLGRDPDMGSTPNGTQVCRFSIATESSWTGKDGEKQKKTDWHRVVVWGKTGELCGQHLAKGRLVMCEGKNATRKYTDKTGVEREITEVIVHSVQFLDSKQGAGSHASGAAGRVADYPGGICSPGQREREPGDDDDETLIPF